MGMTRSTQRTNSVLKSSSSKSAAVVAAADFLTAVGS
jgi:hypothetical protein